MKDGGRFKDRCSFWGARYECKGHLGLSCDHEKAGRCRCGLDSASEEFLPLAPACMTGSYSDMDFNPTTELRIQPNAQLWALNCRCEKTEANSREKPALPDDTDLIRIAAVDFCVNLLKEFDGMWEYDAQWDRHDYSQPARQATEGLDASKCAKSLEDVEKAKISQGSGSTAFWQTALKHVCHAECEEIVHEMKRQSEQVLEVASESRGAAYSDACSILVVRKVESHILGCCGDSCGWDGAKCASARFQASTLSKFQ